VKFSYENNKIELSTWESDAKLFISVKDYGTGISKEDQQIIFDRFKKLDSGINSVYRGHGLGLSINKALIDLLDGDIDIQTEKEKGSEFTISIPEMQNNISGFAFDDNETFFGKGDFSQEDADEIF
jgi:signal transduction histidine kinase